MDEVISGLSVHNRKIVTDILWSFTEIGFQFIVNDHGYVPENSHVYHLEMNGDVSGVKQDYIATKGVYLQGDGDSEYDYSDKGSKVIAVNTDETSEELDSQAGELIDDIPKPESIPVPQAITLNSNVISI
jgi:hypothetical protein